MIHHTWDYRIWGLSLIAVAVMGLIFNGAAPLWAHGGKTHETSEFTSFQAVQKASRLYDRLIAAGKLDGDWETALSSITINTRNTGGKNEFVVRFNLSEGEPDSVYFFFDLAGEYTGSNFNGQ